MAEKPGQFKLELVDEDNAPPASQSGLEGHAADALLLALKALSQRTVVALASLFSLLTAAGVFWLAMAISSDPTVYQIVTLGIFAAFVLCINYIVRKPR